MPLFRQFGGKVFTKHTWVPGYYPQCQKKKKRKSYLHGWPDNLFLTTVKAALLSIPSTQHFLPCLLWFFFLPSHITVTLFVWVIPGMSSVKAGFLHLFRAPGFCTITKYWVNYFWSKFPLSSSLCGPSWSGNHDTPLASVSWMLGSQAFSITRGLLTELWWIFVWPPYLLLQKSWEIRLVVGKLERA